MPYDEAVSMLLANRHFMYRYLWRAFAAEPDETFLDAAQGEHAAQACALLGAQIASIQKRIAEAAGGDGAAAEVLPPLRTAYTRLFVGPAALPAPLWESVYVGSENLLFQASTLDVRSEYRAAGYEAAGYPHEADDHAATELDFMATLAEQACARYEEGDLAAFRTLAERQQRFLERHLGVWAPLFADRIEASEGDGAGILYVLFARLIAEFCRCDADILCELLAEC